MNSYSVIIHTNDEILETTVLTSLYLKAFIYNKLEKGVAIELWHIGGTKGESKTCRLINKGDYHIEGRFESVTSTIELKSTSRNIWELLNTVRFILKDEDF